MDTRNVPLGPLNEILVNEETGAIGMCVGTFWPFSGFHGFTIKLQTLTGEIHELSWTQVRDATPKECFNFETDAGN